MHPDESLILEYTPMVRLIAKKMLKRYPAHIELDDLVQEGMIGLIDAHKRFDSSRGCSASSFVVHRIRGAMIDYLRNQSATYIRHYANQEKLIHWARGRLKLRLGRNPFDSEMAAYFEMTTDKYREYEKNAICPTELSTNQEFSTSDKRSLFEYINERAFDIDLEIDKSRKVINPSDYLDGRDLLVFCLYFKEGLTLKEIGRRIGVSESRAHKILNRSILWIRKQIALGTKEVYKTLRGRPRAST